MARFSDLTVQGQFPHTCAGEKCAICAWVEMREMRRAIDVERARVPINLHGVKPLQDR